MKKIIFLILLLKLAASCSQSQRTPSREEDAAGRVKQSAIHDTIASLQTINKPAKHPNTANAPMDSIFISIMVPENIHNYADTMTRYVNDGGVDPSVSWPFIKRQIRIAYVLLDIDLDGWAGVSYTILKIHPLIEKTLRQFPQIDTVIFKKYPVTMIPIYNWFYR